MKWFDIPDELVPKLRELQTKDSRYPIVKSEDAVVMFYGLGDPLYLTFDGRIIIEDMLDDVPPREAENLVKATSAIVLGAKIQNFPELLSILPKRGENTTDCENCSASGWLEIGKDSFSVVCHQCGGLGWKIQDDKLTKTE